MKKFVKTFFRHFWSMTLHKLAKGLLLFFSCLRLPILPTDSPTTSKFYYLLKIIYFKPCSRSCGCTYIVRYYCFNCLFDWATFSFCTFIVIEFSENALNCLLLVLKISKLLWILASFKRLNLDTHFINYI